jgi:hypothetical protein
MDDILGDLDIDEAVANGGPPPAPAGSAEDDFGLDDLDLDAEFA